MPERIDDDEPCRRRTPISPDERRAVIDVAAIAVGSMVALWIVRSAIRTVVMPRPERVWLTMALLWLARSSAHGIARRIKSPARRHRALGSFGPGVLISLPLVWAISLIAAFSSIFWGLGAGTWSETLELSGSSLTTLGFAAAPTLETRMVAVVEALLGLAIVALMISFLPTIYGTFSRREIAVARLTTRAGEPPDPVEFIARLDTIDRLHLVGERWEAWEDWFGELGETHTTFPALIYFRSARLERSWLSAAEAALDTAAVLRATDLAPPTGQADTMIRSGYLALQAIDDFFVRSSPTDLNSNVTMSVSRADFDHLLDTLEARGVHFDVERDQAWLDYRGWRINYDDAVGRLRARIADDPSHWTRRRELDTLRRRSSIVD